MPDRTAKKGSALRGSAGPGDREGATIEVAWMLISAARNCDDKHTKVLYAARARVMIDKAASDLAELRVNLEAVERGLGEEAKNDA